MNDLKSTIIFLIVVNFHKQIGTNLVFDVTETLLATRFLLNDSQGQSTTEGGAPADKITRTLVYDFKNSTAPCSTS